MAANKGPGQVTVACPYCHAKQSESAFAKSTFCRKCGKHIDIRKLVLPASAPEPAEEKTGFLERFTRLVRREEFKEVRCFSCDAPQTVSSFAKSGSCAHCGVYMDLSSHKITGNFSRNIETHGTIAIDKKGDVTSARLICGTALVLGKVHGNLECTGEMRVKMTGRVPGAIKSKNIVVEKRSDIDFVRPLHVSGIEIHGKVSARIYADFVAISKTGELDGTVHAKSIKIEKGGVFHGDLFIGQPDLEQSELLPVNSKPPKKKMGGPVGDQPSLALA
ncbi:MAG: hypothetical protein QOD99_2943 [Chthoniobacter sp.]|jgi:cytoskeletal protein CcmA (bactofilin family)|nr:hypothetical protein [Chthoniobacter sp.]